MNLYLSVTKASLSATLDLQKTKNDPFIENKNVLLLLRELYDAYGSVVDTMNEHIMSSPISNQLINNNYKYVSASLQASVF